VEARNFDIRKQLLEYDDVANDQRKVIYQQRELLEAAISELIDRCAMALHRSGARIRAGRIGGRAVESGRPGKSLAAEWQIDCRCAPWKPKPI
jgi:hypothetical protein